MSPQDLPTLPFSTQKAFEEWMEKHHDSSQGIWVQFFKKNSGVTSMTYPEAVDVALCYGWIDSQVKGLDVKSYLQKFTPRRSKSVWSKINTGHVIRLISEGRMKPSGLWEVEEAKKDGRWMKAYDSPSTMTLPEDFLKELAKHKKAKAFFDTLNKTNKYTIAYKINSAKKPETKARRIQTLITMLEKGEKEY